MVASLQGHASPMLPPATVLACWLSAAHIIATLIRKGADQAIMHSLVKVWRIDGCLKLHFNIQHIKYVSAKLHFQRKCSKYAEH